MAKKLELDSGVVLMIAITVMATISVVAYLISSTIKETSCYENYGTYKDGQCVERIRQAE